MCGEKHSQLGGWVEQTARVGLMRIFPGGEGGYYGDQRGEVAVR